MKTKVQLVLGSGGARGLAHIGVIERLVEDGYEIAEIVGCSMGAVVGGLYAAGFLPQYKEFICKQTKSDIYGLFDFALSRQGFLKGEKVFNVLQQMAGDQLIENLPIAFTAVATDILTRTEFHFKSGNLFKALRASTGVPGVFTPVAENKSLFVDGGVLNPVPVNLISRREDAIVVVVNLNGAVPTEIAPAEASPPPAETAADEASALNENAGTLMQRLRAYFSTASKPDETPSLSMFEIYTASFDAMFDKLTQMSIELNPPDLVVEIPRSAASTFEFHRANELIQLGRQAYDKAINAAKPSMRRL